MKHFRIKSLRNTITKWHRRLTSFVVTRKRFESELARRDGAICELRSRYKREITDSIKTAQAIIRRCSRIDFQQRDCTDTYAVTVSFDARMMSLGHPDQRELAMIAQCVGRDVECEISRSRFIQPPESRREHSRLRR